MLFAAVLGLTSWGLHALRLRWGLAVRYYLLVGTTGLVALMVFNVSVPWFGRIPVLGDAISYWHIIM